MDLSWISTPVTAVAGLVGVAITAHRASTANAKQLQQADDREERERRRLDRDRIYEAVERVRDVFQSAETLATRSRAAHEHPEPSFDDEAAFISWWEPIVQGLSRDIALIKEDDFRSNLTLLKDTVSEAQLINMELWKPSMDSVVEKASRTAFEVASAWLRDQPLPEAVAKDVEEAKAQMNEYVESAQALQEAATEAKKQRKKNPQAKGHRDA